VYDTFVGADKNKFAKNLNDLNKTTMSKAGTHSSMNFK
jgi:hypothetical protein